MKLKVIIISLWAFICLLMACYEDKGNYDLVDYNQIEKIGEFIVQIFNNLGRYVETCYGFYVEIS